MSRFDKSRYAMDDALWFDGVAAKGAGRNNIYGTAGDDTLRGTPGGDNFRVDQGGDDTLRGGDGNDRFFFKGTYTDQDVVFGGDGVDRMILSGTTDSHLVLGPDALRSVESIKLTGGTYDVTLQNGVSDLRISVYSGSSDLSVDASQVSNANIKVIAGTQDDMLTGGFGDDVLVGSFGSDILIGGMGYDVFKYRSMFDSTEKFSNEADTIYDFSTEDRILLPTTAVEVTDYHIGLTNERVGDVTAKFDEESNTTRIDIFLDGDTQPDMTIYTFGDSSDISVVQHASLVL